MLNLCRPFVSLLCKNNNCGHSIFVVWCSPSHSEGRRSTGKSFHGLHSNTRGFVQWVWACVHSAVCRKSWAQSHMDAKKGLAFPSYTVNLFYHQICIFMLYYIQARQNLCLLSSPPSALLCCLLETYLFTLKYPSEDCSGLLSCYYISI